MQDITAAARLHTEAHPSSVILASPNALVIGAVANFDKLHIRSVCCDSMALDHLLITRQIPLGYNSPRRIVHSPSWGVFAVACTRPTPAQIGQAEVFSSSVQVFNHTSFESQ